jgi:hypothetical protein
MSAVPRTGLASCRAPLRCACGAPVGEARLLTNTEALPVLAVGRPHAPLPPRDCWFAVVAEFHVDGGEAPVQVAYTFNATAAEGPLPSPPGGVAPLGASIPPRSQCVSTWLPVGAWRCVHRAVSSDASVDGTDAADGSVRATVWLGELGCAG